MVQKNKACGKCTHLYFFQTLIPPFSATAMVAGNSYIKTFDGKFYEINHSGGGQRDGRGGCSYLLTADFMYKRFSVILNYKADDR